MDVGFCLKKALIAYAAAASLLIASPGHALTVAWDTIGWDPNDTSGSQTFVDVDGSGIDVVVSYSDNMFYNSSVPLLYDSRNSPTDEILGSLKFTNDVSSNATPTNVTLTFSQNVSIENTFMVSHSIVRSQEHTLVEAFNEFGAPVAASIYGTTSPALVSLDMDGDAAYETIGLGLQSNGEYGNAFWEYASPVRSISYSFWTTEVGGTEVMGSGASVGIGNVTFVPEPGTGLLVSLGLAGIALSARRLRAEPRNLG